MVRQEDIEYMRRAMELAERGVGFTNPNPMVGAVIVKGGKVIGEGWHERCGDGMRRGTLSRIVRFPRRVPRCT